MGFAKGRTWCWEADRAEGDLWDLFSEQLLTGDQGLKPCSPPQEWEPLTFKASNS